MEQSHDVHLEDKTTSLRPLPTMSSSAWMRLTGICKASAAVRLVRVRITCMKHGAFLSMFFPDLRTNWEGLNADHVAGFVLHRPKSSPD